VLTDVQLDLVRPIGAAPRHDPVPAVHHFTLLTTHPLTHLHLSLAPIGGLLFFVGRFVADPWAF
jgi:hypothetical protein